jgi:beta-1,4-N-acetylglucosaminyltransferase
VFPNIRFSFDRPNTENLSVDSSVFISMPSAQEKVERNVLVTVGTTRFEKLISAATSSIALDWMAAQGYTSLTLQYGTGQTPNIDLVNSPVTIQCYDFQPSLDKDMEKAELVLSHAGAGTVMEALRLKKKLVVVINTLLMDNHQTELADAMAKRGHICVVDEPDKLDDQTTWQSFEGFSPISFAGGDEMDFPRLLDARMGFAPSKDE